MITRKYTIDGFVITESDRNVYIHGGDPEGDYIYAIDPIGKYREYTETDKPVPEEAGETDTDDKAEAEDYEKALATVGVIKNDDKN